jgi:hypothetical protein
MGKWGQNVYAGQVAVCCLGNVVNLNGCAKGVLHMRLCESLCAS